jgi:hypothetical protein
MTDEAEFFKLRREGKTYISKVFSFNEQSMDRLRNVRMVIEGSDVLHLGEIEGTLCLRLTGKKRKTQISAIVSQDHKQIRRLSFQTFQLRSQDWINGYEKEEFTFRKDEFERLLSFLQQINFINLVNEDNFQIDDISTRSGPKTIIDSSDRAIVERIKSLGEGQRDALLKAIGASLTNDEINILLGRREALFEFEEHMSKRDWSESDWQSFFDRQQWVFGYGLDYRVMRTFDREMVVGGQGTDNKNKPIVDFLGTFKDYTVLIEIKKPDTKIFKNSRGGRAGTWEFSQDFTNAISQILEQKAEWLSFAQAGDHWNKEGTRRLEARTRNSKTILVIGSSQEFEASDNSRSAQIMRDTFELFRRENRSIDILTFDELLERACFITRSE